MEAVTLQAPATTEPVEVGSVMFNDLPIRFVVLDDLPHYFAEDICQMLSMKLDPVLDVVADVHKRQGRIPSPNGDQLVDVITPIAAWTLTLYLSGIRDDEERKEAQKWIFRETKKIRPDAFNRDKHGAAQCMALLPSGELPPRPFKRSGRRCEWEKLQFDHKLYQFVYQLNARCDEIAKGLRIPRVIPFRPTPEWLLQLLEAGETY